MGTVLFYRGTVPIKKKMGIKFEQISGATSGQADQDYFLDEQGAVTTDDAMAATLLIRKGQEVPKEMADKYGIGKVAQSADETTGDEAVKSEAPAENKAQRPGKNKAGAK